MGKFCERDTISSCLVFSSIFLQETKKYFEVNNATIEDLRKFHFLKFEDSKTGHVYKKISK